MTAPTEKQRAIAEAIVKKYSDREVIALVGNWRAPKVPPLAEFVAHTLLVEKASGALIPFEPWEAQREALEVIEAHDHLVVPKGRQIGMTSLILAAMLHAATFYPHRLFLVARQSDDYAQDAITRLLVLAGLDPFGEAGNLQVLSESLLPSAWRPQVVAKSARVLTFANGSVFKALTATQRMGRGLSAHWGLADEFAFWPWPAEQLAALESCCARLDVISTGAGEGDAFHQLYLNAAAGKGAYHAYFLSSDADPRRDDEWYRRNVEEAAQPDLARREYARSIEDAFRAPGVHYFTRFDPKRHVGEIGIVSNWNTFCGVDFGLRHAACLWCQRSPTGQLFIVDELLVENLTTREFAREIKAHQVPFDLVEPVVAHYCDPAGRGANTQTSLSDFEIFEAEGLLPEATPSGVRDGCLRITDTLADTEQPLIIASRCSGLIKALSQVRPHRSHPEYYDKDHEIYSHPLDALRYLLINISPPVGDWLPERPERRPTPRLH